MKKTLIVVLCMVLVVMASAFVLAACNSASVKVTLMDGDTVLDTIDVEVGKGFTLPTPTKANYTFANWYTDADLTNVYVADKVMAALTLYAKFTPNEYNVIINPEGGEMEAADRVVKVYPNTAYQLNVPTREGYTFAGYTYYDATGAAVPFPTTGTYALTDSIRVYAQWTEAQYTVVFKDGDTVLDTKTVSHGTTVYAPNATKTGYTFAGWTDDKGNTTAANVTSFVATQDVVYTANNTANQYTISFNVVGGTDIAPLQVTYDGTYTLPAAEKSGYTFVGYTLDGVAFPSTGTYTKASPITVTATYTQNMVTVTFVDEAAEARTETIAQNATITAPLATAKLGHDFARWATEANGTAAFDFGTPITANLTLYAVYTPIQYTLTVVNMASATGTVTFGTQYALPTDNVVYPDWAVADSFAGYEKDGVDFPATGTYIWAEPITVTAKFTHDPSYNKSTVTVIGLGANQEIVVDDGTTAADELAALDTAKTGYTFEGWSTTQNAYTPFDVDTVINENVIVYAYYTANEYKIYVMDGDTKIDTVSVTYDGIYNIVTTGYTKPGYTFNGLTYNGNPFTALSGEHYTFAAENIYVYASYTQKKVNVRFWANGEQYGDTEVINQLATVSAPATDPAKTGCNFRGWSTTQGDYTAYNFGAAVTNEPDQYLDLYAFFDAKTLSIKVERYDTSTTMVTATYGENLDLNALTPASRQNYKFVGFKRGDAAFYGDSLSLADYEAGAEITITEDWQAVNYNPDADDSDKTFVKTAGGYFKERETTNDNFTLVFVTNKPYTLPVKSIGTNPYISKVGNVYQVGDLTTEGLVDGTFDMEVTKDVQDGDDTVEVTYTRKVKIVSNVSYGYGESYSAVWNLVPDTQDYNTYYKNFQNKRGNNTVMDVGVQDFRFDITLNSSTSQGVVSLAAEKAYLQVSVTAGGNPTSAYTLNQNGSIDFDASLLGQTVEVSVAPKYALEGTPVTFSMQLNDGVNVYTNSELRAKYADTSIGKINVLRNIKAEFQPGDYDLSDGGHGKLIEKVDVYTDVNDKANTTTQIEIDTGTPKNDYLTSVYARVINSNNAAAERDRIVINGNFFMIDGQQLPYVDNKHSARSYDGGVGANLANVQIGIFLYRNYYDDGNESCRYNNGHLSINNLLVEGNNIYGADLLQDVAGESLPLLKMSAALNGIWCRGGTVDLDNVSIQKTLIAVASDSDIDGHSWKDMTTTNKEHAVIYNIANCRFTDNWGDDIYGYRVTQFNITNTYLGQCEGGATIVIDDKPQPPTGTQTKDDIYIAFELNMDYYTLSHIQNWVTGGEAWFKSRGQDEIARGAKDAIQNGLDYLATQVSSNTGGAISFSLKVKNVVDATEYMNFCFLVQPRGDNSGANGWTNDTEGSAYVVLNANSDLVKVATTDQTSMEDFAAKLGIPAGYVNAIVPGIVDGAAGSGLTFYYTKDGNKIQLYAVANQGGMIIGLPIYPASEVPAIS